MKFEIFKYYCLKINKDIQFEKINSDTYTYSDLLCLSSSTRVAASKALVVYREELKYLASRQELETTFSWTVRQAEAIVLFLNPPPTEPQNQQVGDISETASKWLIPFAPFWRSPETLSYPSYRPTQVVISVTGLGSYFTTS